MDTLHPNSAPELQLSAEPSATNPHRKVIGNVAGPSGGPLTRLGPSHDSDSDEPGPPPPPAANSLRQEEEEEEEEEEKEWEPEFDPSEQEYDTDLPQFPITHEIILKDHTKVVSALALDPSGARIVSGSHDYDCKLWDFGGMDMRCKPFKSWEPAETYHVRFILTPYL